MSRREIETEKEYQDIEGNTEESFQVFLLPHISQT
jgi:hypothetical protein